MKLELVTFKERCVFEPRILFFMWHRHVLKVIIHSKVVLQCALDFSTLQIQIKLVVTKLFTLFVLYFSFKSFRKPCKGFV